MPNKTKGAGGKLSRSEIIQARLSPRMKFAAEIIARNERRTLSSLIETLFENAMQEYWVDAEDDLGEMCPLSEVVHELWHSNEAIRFVKFAWYLPQLLQPDEENLWHKIKEIKYFWCCEEHVIKDENNKIIRKSWEPILHEAALIDSHLTQYWPILQTDLQSNELTKIREKIGEKIGYLANEQEDDDHDDEKALDPIAVKQREELSKQFEKDMKTMKEITKRLNSFWPRRYRVNLRSPSQKIINRLLKNNKKGNQ